MQVGFVHENIYGWDGNAPTKNSETLKMHAVAASKYPEDGSDEDNTFAKFSPGADLSINIANPALWGKFKVGQKYYVDFTSADPLPVVDVGGDGSQLTPLPAPAPADAPVVHVGADGGQEA